MSLNCSILESPVPQPVQEQISCQLWNPPESHPLRPYFQYYTEQCRTAYHAYSGCLPTRTHQDVLDIATDIIQGASRPNVKKNVTVKHSNDAPDASIDLTVRLLLMLDVGELRNAFSGRKRLLWVNGSLQDFVHEIFRPEQALGHEGIKLGTVFTAHNLGRIAGFKVELTTNLADHLRFRDDDQTVTIFHHASFLKYQRDNPLFPAGFISETLRTLSLLFPQGDKNSQRWYRKQEDPEELDLSLFKCGSAHRQIEEYKYWHDRLVILKQAFDESRPSTFSQWWNDRREGLQWVTLWVAIGFTVFFGLVQSIEGGLQVYKSWHPTPT